MKKIMVAAATGILALGLFAQAPATKTKPPAASATPAAQVKAQSTEKVAVKRAVKAHKHHAHKATSKAPAATVPAK